MMEHVYGRLLAHALFPAFEAARGRPTVPLLRYLHATEWWSPDALRELQAGLLRRLPPPPAHHPPYYPRVLGGRGLQPPDFCSGSHPPLFPVLHPPALPAALGERWAPAPPPRLV